MYVFSDYIKPIRSRTTFCASFELSSAYRLYNTCFTCIAHNASTPVRHEKYDDKLVFLAFTLFSVHLALLFFLLSLQRIILTSMTFICIWKCLWFSLAPCHSIGYRLHCIRVKWSVLRTAINQVHLNCVQFVMIEYGLFTHQFCIWMLFSYLNSSKTIRLKCNLVL